LNATNNQQARQPVRPGAAPLSVVVTSDNEAVGTVTSPVVFGAGQDVRTTAFDPAAAGTATVMVVKPDGFTLPSNLQSVAATVTASGISLGNVTVGKDLQETWSASLDAPAPTGGVDVTITSGDASRVLLSQSATTHGSAAITIPLAAGASTTGTFFVQALAGSGSVTVTVSAPGYTTDTGTVTLVPSGFVVGRFTNPVLSSTLSTTTLSAPTSLEVWSMPLDPTTLNATNNAQARQSLRPGAAPLNVVVTSDMPAVGTVTVSPVVFSGNQESRTTTFDPQTAGTATVEVQTPPGFVTPSNLQSLAATVTAPNLTLSAPTVGKDLQESVNVSLEVAAPAGGVSVTVTVADVTKARLKDTAVIPGTSNLTLVIPAGTASKTFFVEALQGSGTVQYTATATQYDPDTKSITLVPSGFVIDNITTSPITSSLAGADTTLRIKPARLDPTTLNFALVQSLRPGMTNTQVFIASDHPEFGVITLSPVTFDGADSPNERVTSFSPQAVGTTVIRVTSPGFSSASNRNNITVNMVP
jgi:hypothetical protein